MCQENINIVFVTELCHKVIIFSIIGHTNSKMSQMLYVRTVKGNVRRTDLEVDLHGLGFLVSHVDPCRQHLVGAQTTPHHHCHHHHQHHCISGWIASFDIIVLIIKISLSALSLPASESTADKQQHQSMTSISTTIKEHHQTLL